MIGTPCTDFNACTTNDVFTTNCTCEGIFVDLDGDGTCNANDMCPTDPLKISPGTCGCGNVDIDTDNDGVCDDVDDCLDNLFISSTMTGTQLFEAIIKIESDAVVLPNADIEFSAGQEIIMHPGFETSPSARFHAYILGCSN